MNNRLILLCLTLTLSSALSTVLTAQTYEVGAFFGGANYIGDVGKTQFIAPVGPTFGGIAKWNRSTRHSFRLTYLVGQIIADDVVDRRPTDSTANHASKESAVSRSRAISPAFPG